ncbi:MAG: PspC domain-containing protein [Sinomonas sp.]|nr:PspC domain-containing protein [Sinomonas sp.]
MSTEQTPGGPESPAPGHPSGQHPGRAGSDFFGWIRGLGVTRGSDRWAGGVASGLAHRWGVDPILVRGLFIVAAIFLGIGVLAYGVLWLLLPEPDGRIHVQEAMRGRWTAGMTGGLIATILGLGGARAGFWFGEMRGAGPFWAVFWVGVACLVVFSITRSRRARRAEGAAAYPPSHEASAHSASAASSPNTYSSPGSYSFPGPYGSGAYGSGSSANPSGYGDTAPYGGPYGSGPHGHRFGPAPVRSAPRSTAVRAHRRGPGGAFVAVVLGLAVIVAGGLLALQLSGVATIDPSTGVLWAIGAGILGLGIIAAGLSGRTGGLLSFLAVVALIIAAATQPAYMLSRPRGAVNLAPASVQQATAGYDVTASSGQLDLRKLDDAGPLAAEAVVPVNSTMSQLQIRIPKNVPVRVEADATMSNVRFGDKSIAGFTTTDSETYNAGRAGATLVVKVDATMSNVDVEQEH